MAHLIGNREFDNRNRARNGKETSICSKEREGGMVIRVGKWNWGGFVGKRVEEMKVKKELEGSRVSVPNRMKQSVWECW